MDQTFESLEHPCYRAERNRDYDRLWSLAADTRPR